MRRRDARGELELPAPREPYRRPVGGHLALDFANTVDDHSENRGYDYLFPGYGNLVGWALFARVVDAEQATAFMRLAKREPREAVAVRRRAVALRDAVYNTFREEGPGPDDFAVLNDEWRRAVVHRELVPGDDGHPQWVWADEVSLERILWPIAFAAVDLVTSEQRARIRQCESPTCQWLFLDTTRNGSRRFCSSQECGNRVRVQRFREARRESS